MGYTDRCGELECLRRPPVDESARRTTTFGGQVVADYRCRRCGRRWTTSYLAEAARMRDTA
jgi:hypothetical protein